jgi:DNA-binding CsgD family transcriptional regulator
VLEGATSLRDKVWTRIIDPSTWTGVLYEVAQFPLGVAAFVTVVAGFSVAGALIGAPVIAWLDDTPLRLTDDLVITDPIEAAPLVPLGIIAWVVTMHAVIAFSTLHALWARLLLGSRARHQPVTSQPSGPGAPDPAPGTPVAVLAAPASAIAIEAPAANPPEADTPREEGAAAVAGPSIAPQHQAAGLISQYTEESEAADHPALAELTAREREVFLLAVRGYSNADICEACYISEGTVKTHIRHILAKLDLLDRTQLIVFAYEQGIVQPSRRPVAMAIAR